MSKALYNLNGAVLYIYLISWAIKEYRPIKGKMCSKLIVCFSGKVISFFESRILKSTRVFLLFFFLNSVDGQNYDIPAFIRLVLPWSGNYRRNVGNKFCTYSLEAHVHINLPSLWSTSTKSCFVPVPWAVEAGGFTACFWQTCWALSKSGHNPVDTFSLMAISVRKPQVDMNDHVSLKKKERKKYWPERVHPLAP